MAKKRDVYIGGESETKMVPPKEYASFFDKIKFYIVLAILLALALIGTFLI